MKAGFWEYSLASLIALRSLFPKAGCEERVLISPVIRHQACQTSRGSIVSWLGIAVAYRLGATLSYHLR
jgi:hypothetical protein